jgi:peptidoglycan/LPS O-acetylase OafA/YrhL
LVLSSLLLLAFYDIQTFKNLLSEHFLYGVAFGILAFALSVYPLGALVNPVTKAIGKLSYAIFLSHFGIIIIFRTIFPGGFPVQGDLGCFAAFAAIFAVSAGVAFLLYHLIEKLGTQIGRILIAKL